MRNKAIISLFLSFLLACTVLPVREVGNLIAGNQMQEELPHSTESGKEIGKEDGKSVWFYHEFAEISSYALLSNGTFCPESVTLPDHFVGEIQTPPPNAA